MDPEESSIERLKRTLYSRNEDLVPKEKRTPVGPHEVEAPTNWGEPKVFDISPDVMMKKNNSFFNKFLLGSLVFFLISLGVAMFIFFGGLNMISSNNLDVRITAPSSISSGEELDIGLTIVNANRADLEGVTLFIDYPEGAQTVGQDSEVISHDQIDLSTIPEGGTKDYTIRTLLFGEKDVIKTFIFRIEYKVKGSNAVFSKEKIYDVVIGSSPILLNVDFPKEVNSGQPMTITIDVTSNSSVPIKNALVKVDYPYGFTYKSSNVSPLRGSSVWNIGDLKNGDKKTLTITGTLLGQNLEDRSFQISTGAQSATTVGTFDTTLAASTITVGIRKSFFDLAVTPTFGPVSSMGDPVPITIKWQNTLPDKVVNNKIEVTLSGNVFDRSRVTVSNNGFYRSADNMIFWDKNTTNILTSFLPGDIGQVSFTVASVPNSLQSATIKNPYINVHVEMVGDRSGVDTTEVSSTEDLVIKIASTLSLSAKSFRAIGPFTNTGPIPPKADTESTYTITWTLTNTTNDLKETKVSTTLPTGIIWKGQVSPAGEKVSFDPDTRVVSWNVGNISAGAGFTYSPKEVSFKVAIVPSINQVGSSPLLISDTNVTAVDTYTEKTLTASSQPITTRYSDPSFTSGLDIVTN